MLPGVLVVPAVVALAAALVLATRPAARAHQAFAALLAVQAAFMAASSFLAAAPTLAEATVAARLMTWYAIPVPLLTLAFASTAFGARPWRRTLAVAGLGTLALLATFALAPRLLLADVVPRGAGHAASSGTLLYALSVAYVVASAALLLAAARASRDEARTEAARLHAATTALAFALLPLYSGAFFLGRVLAAPHELVAPAYFARAVATIAGGALAAWLAPRFARAFRRDARLAALGLLAVVSALGALDGLASARVAALRVPGYDNSVTMLRVAFALVALLAALRYGLADAGDALRRAMRRAAVAAGLALAGLLAAAAVLAALGGNPVGYGVAPLAAATAGALAWRPLQAAAPRLLLPRDDPRAVAERARTYASALAAATRADGSLHPEGARLLARLRRDLGLSEGEHELLRHALRSRAATPGSETPRFGRYRLERELGRGAAGVTWLARDEADRRVVVKRILHARDAGRVLAEARALAAVRHPRVVRLLEVDRRDEETFLVLSYAPGGSLRSLLDVTGPLPPPRALALVGDLLDGLSALHRAGITHRDVKLENVLLDGDGRALLADFGSARVSDADATLTGQGVEGTLATIAPEVLRGLPATPASDLYAAGAVLYRLLTGEHYVDIGGGDGFATRSRVLLDPPRLPHPGVPPALEPVLRRALAKDPAERHASAEEMRAALAAVGA